MAIIDVVTFNGEQDLFDLRYQILKDYVDEFIVLEFDKTFSGKPKRRTFTRVLPPKVTYHFVTEDVYSKYQALAGGSPNTRGADHWKREFCQKESIKDYLTHLKDTDLVFIGDVDEIWNPKGILLDKYPNKLKLRVYTYYLNNRSTEEFWGTLAGEYRYIKESCLNHLRTEAPKQTYYSGWHFTSMGGYEEVKRKLSDSYTQESYWTPLVEQNLQENMAKNKDFLGRGFNFVQDESEWPQYLKDHKDQWKHLLA